MLPDIVLNQLNLPGGPSRDFLDISVLLLTLEFYIPKCLNQYVLATQTLVRQEMLKIENQHLGTVSVRMEV